MANYVFLIVMLILFYPYLSYAQKMDDLFKVISPEENAEIIVKKPEIKVEFAETVKSETIVVLFPDFDS